MLTLTEDRTFCDQEGVCCFSTFWELKRRGLFYVCVIRICRYWRYKVLIKWNVNWEICTECSYVVKSILFMIYYVDIIIFLTCSWKWNYFFAKILYTLKRFWRLIAFFAEYTSLEHTSKNWSQIVCETFLRVFMQTFQCKLIHKWLIIVPHNNIFWLFHRI